jgi:hypothetical protein
MPLCCCLLQESGSISEWERLLVASLPPDGGYERIAWQSLRAIHLVLFASKHFRRQVLSIRGSAVATGIGNLVGNKVSPTCQARQLATPAAAAAATAGSCCTSDQAVCNAAGCCCLVFEVQHVPDEGTMPLCLPLLAAGCCGAVCATA